MHSNNLAERREGNNPNLENFHIRIFHREMIQMHTNNQRAETFGEVMEMNCIT